MCKYCEEQEDLLVGEIEQFNDIYLFGKNRDNDTMTIREIKDALEIEQVRVFYDRGYLRLTKGDDVGCLDHSEDRIKANYCIECGKKIS